MFYPEFTKQYVEKIRNHPSDYVSNARALLANSVETRRLYHGTVIPMTYQGIFFTPKEVRRFSAIIQMMVQIGRKVTEEYVQNPEYRTGFHFDPVTEELILLDPGYEIPVPVGRYDIFYNGDGREAAAQSEAVDASVAEDVETYGDFTFCEFNTDGSSAMNEDRVLGGLLLQSKIMKEMGEDWKISQFSLFDDLVEKMLSRYEKIKGAPAKTVAIVDFVDKGTTLEFQVFREAFQRFGVQALICDVRDMRYEKSTDGKVGTLVGVDVDTGERAPIDLVYRRMVTSDFVERRSEAQAFEEAYRDQAFLSFGSFRSQVMHAKTTFAVLHNEKTKAILTPEENAFIARHVPWTKEVVDEEDKRVLLERKDDFILKPYNLYASQGVLLGREHDAKEWETIIADLPLDRYIYQEYVDVDPTPFVVLDELSDASKAETAGVTERGKGAAQEKEASGGGFHIELLGHVIGLFLYDEAFAGSYTRIGAQGIISGAREYFAAPAFLVQA